MTGTELVRALWERFEARDWEGAEALLADDFVCRWPHSDERFEGAANFVAMNRAYPEGWSIEVLDVLEQGDQVASRIRVTQDASVFCAASFFTVRDGRLADAFEYWTTVGEEDPPDWRRPFASPGSGA